MKKDKIFYKPRKTKIDKNIYAGHIYVKTFNGGLYDLTSIFGEGNEPRDISDKRLETLLTSGYGYYKAVYVDEDTPVVFNGKEYRMTDVETELKALEIIVEKRVDVQMLLHSENAYVYNELQIIKKEQYNLTQEEFDSLRNILNNEN